MQEVRQSEANQNQAGENLLSDLHSGSVSLKHAEAHEFRKNFYDCEIHAREFITRPEVPKLNVR